MCEVLHTAGWGPLKLVSQRRLAYYTIEIAWILQSDDLTGCEVNPQERSLRGNRDGSLLTWSEPDTSYHRQIRRDDLHSRFGAKCATLLRPALATRTDHGNHVRHTLPCAVDLLTFLICNQRDGIPIEISCRARLRVYP